MKPLAHKSQKGKGRDYFDLSAKLYTMLCSAATIFLYSRNLGFATPSEGSSIRGWILGVGLVIGSDCIWFFPLKNVKGNSDERFYANLARQLA